MTEREFAIDVVRRLRSAGFEALWAGGCVRDELMGHLPHDYDVATNARPEQVQKLFRRTVAVGASFGVIEVIGPRVENEQLQVEVVTFRSDGAYTDGRHPDAVTFGSAREDALRRDFTINGMFFDPLENRLIDYVGGQADLQAKVLRAIGAPRERFHEDKLRLLRAVRFAARFELNLDPATAEAIRAMAAELPVVSAERIAEELRKLLTDRHRVRGLELLDEVGLLAVILPEMARMHGGLWQHTLRVIEQLPEQVSFELAFAALLYDVGSRDLADAIAERLKFANAERERIGWLVEKRQYLFDAPTMRPSKLKVVLAHPGVHELLALHRADAVASGRESSHVDFATAKRREWTASGELNPPPLLTGDDLKTLGIPPGPEYKRLLDAVREAQLDGTITARDEALALMTQMRSSP
jgi:poly(A) polymerase